jgi:hypothetical protein
VDDDVIRVGSIGQGGQYTTNTVPPKLWVSLEFDPSLAAAYKFVEDLKPALENISVVELSGLTRIGHQSNEQDVVKLFTMFVLHPVEIVLAQIKLSESCRLELRTKLHAEEGRKIRYDIMLEGHGPQGIKTLTVMGIKNFGVIKKEMGHILAVKVSSIQEAQKLAPTSGFRFAAGSILLLRECAAYAAKFETRHVAIYLDFIQLPEAMCANKDPDAGGFAGDFVLIHTQTDPSTFHYALLAFFKRAVTEWMQDAR